MSEYGLPYRGVTPATLTILRCHPLFSITRRPVGLRQWLIYITRGIAQSFRLMVGVQDYPTYVRHMQLHHPQQPPMTEKEFHRYCLNARFPSEAGKLGKCPC